MYALRLRTGQSGLGALEVMSTQTVMPGSTGCSDRTRRPKSPASPMSGASSSMSINLPARPSQKRRSAASLIFMPWKVRYEASHPTSVLRFDKNALNPFSTIWNIGSPPNCAQSPARHRSQRRSAMRSRVSPNSDRIWATDGWSRTTTPPNVPCAPSRSAERTTSSWDHRQAARPPPSPILSSRPPSSTMSIPKHGSLT